MSGVVASTADGVLTLTFDRPQRRNSLDHDAMDELVGHLERASKDDSLRVIHLTGAGEHFCSGSDWVSVNKAGDTQPEKPRTGGIVRRTPVQAHRIIELLLEVQLPIVASVRGFAAGLGCHMALAADLTVAAEDALFWEPFSARGFTPDSGGTWLLPRLVGVARAKRMLLLGEQVSGTVAAEWGLIHAAVPEADLDAAASALVGTLASGPTVTLGLTRQLVNRGLEATLAQALTNEAFALELSSRSEDFKEGLAAFKEKRSPDFSGR